MVPALKSPKPTFSRRDRLHARPSRLALLQGAVKSAQWGELHGAERETQLRARLMHVAGCPIYVTDQMEKGAATIVDPSTMTDEQRTDCPFKVRTLVIHPDDIEQAIAHFEQPAGTH